MIKKLDHLVITTEDFTACAEFYKVLGFTVKNAGSRLELFAGDFKINVHLKGQELEPKAEYVQTGSADLCFEIDEEAEDCMSGLIQKGIQVELGPVIRHGVRGEMHSIYLRDPDKNLIELCCYE